MSQGVLNTHAADRIHPEHLNEKEKHKLNQNPVQIY